MKKTLINVALFFAAFNLAACSSNPFYDSNTPQPVAANPQQGAQQNQIGGTQELTPESGEAPIKAGMDDNDKSKMLHALDNAIGKSSAWVNANTGVSYTITPIKKVTIDGNSLCREYETIANKGNQERKSYGSACVGTDGAWHAKSSM